MATAFVPSSSEFVCDNIARRTVRDSDKIVGEQTVSAFINPFLKPIVMKLATGARFPRLALRKMVIQLESKLMESPQTFALEASEFTTSKLSARERYRIVFKMPSTLGESEDWMGFTATEVNLTRNEVEVAYSNVDVIIHRHAISRFIQREEKMPDEMFKNLSEAINVASVLGWPILARGKAMDEGRNIAVPLGTGMLFGRVKAYKGGVERGFFTITRKTADHNELPRNEGVDYQMHVELMTYVDYNSLTPSREALRDKINEFVENNVHGIKIISDSIYYTGMALPAEVGMEAEAHITATKEAAKALLECAEWEQFIHSVGR